jgi:hypothetical protein
MIRSDSESFWIIGMFITMPLVVIILNFIFQGWGIGNTNPYIRYLQQHKINADTYLYMANNLKFTVYFLVKVIESALTIICTIRGAYCLAFYKISDQKSCANLFSTKWILIYFFVIFALATGLYVPVLNTVFEWF